MKKKRYVWVVLNRRNGINYLQIGLKPVVSPISGCRVEKWTLVPPPHPTAKQINAAFIEADRKSGMSKAFFGPRPQTKFFKMLTKGIKMELRPARKKRRKK